MNFQAYLPNRISYNTVIDACVRDNNKLEDAFGLMHEMEFAGIAADEITYATVIKACSKGGEGGKGSKLIEDNERK